MATTKKVIPVFTETEMDNMAMHDQLPKKATVKKSTKVVDNTLVKPDTSKVVVPVDLATSQPELIQVSQPHKAEAKKREEKFSPDFQLLSINPDAISEGGTLEVSLSELINLDATPIKNARFAMREVNKEHMEALKIGYLRGDDMPSVVVVPSTMGLIVVDGYHRWGAMESIVEDQINELRGKTDEEGLKRALADKRIATRLFVVPLSDMTERATVQYAFEANLRNGLPLSTNSRSRYAIWLLEDAKEHGDKLSIRQAASMAGVSHVAVIKMMGRIADKAEKMVDKFGDTEDEVDETLTEEKEQKETDTLKKATKQLFAAIKNITKELDNVDQLYSYFLESDFVKADLIPEIAIIAEALTVLSASSEDDEEETEE